MSVMSRGEQMQSVLRNLVNSDPDLEGAAVVTMDGLPLSSVLPPGTDEDRVAAMGAAALSTGSRTASELRRGGLEQVLLKGELGYVILIQAGSDTVLQAISSSDARLGLLLFEMKSAAQQLARALG